MAGSEEDAVEEVAPEFECTICMKLLLDPVTVSCGHTFCRACLAQSLGYRSQCAVCRAPVASGQGVNILVRSVIAERYPRALAQRQQELEQELLSSEREANDARRREAEEAVRPPGGAADAVLLPILRRPSWETPPMPHCTSELVLSFDEQALLEHVLRGSRRFAVLEADEAFDDGARPMGVCLEVQHVERRPNGQQLGQGVRVSLVGKFRFWLVEPPQRHDLGFEQGRVEAFFDEALSPADLVVVREEQAEGEAPRAGPSVPEVAMAALELLEAQFVHVGQAGRHVFEAKFGAVPTLRPDGATGATTSANLERVSFWLLGAILMDAADRRRWLASADTRGRLEFCRHKLSIAGSRPVLDLPGAGSWMNPGQSGLGSFLLLLAIVVLFAAKALGLLDKRARSSRHYDMEDSSLMEAFNFGQLLR